MSRLLFVFFGLVMVMGGCTQRLICPAYQSAFIYDKETLRKKFSYFENDSIPRVFTASTSKNKYLVAVPESYRKKYRSLQTVEMKPIYPIIPDSLKADGEADSLMAEGNIITADSTTATEPPTEVEAGDSAYAITKTKEKFNVDQDNYMWYFRDVLVLPDVRAAMEDKKAGQDEASGGSKTGSKKSGFFGFFKDLFKKKPKDSTAVNAPPLPNSDEQSDLQADPEPDLTAAPKPKNKEKKRLNPFRKKKTDKKNATSEKKKEDAKKEEDDGF